MKYKPFTTDSTEEIIKDIKHSLPNIENDRMFNMFLRLDEQNKSIMDYYNEGYCIICDRYTSSNYLYMTHGLLYNEFVDFINELEDIEYNHMGLPKPDLSIFFELTPEKSLELINKRGLEKDNHETNEILTKAYESLQRYKQFTKTEESLNNTVHFINCLNSQNDLYSIEDIFREVRNCLLK